VASPGAFGDGDDPVRVPTVEGSTGREP
jgi:hypothetical protein